MTTNHSLDVSLQLKKSALILDELSNSESVTEVISHACNVLTTCLANKRCVFAIGNGGSAADAQHFSAELVSRFLIDRDPLRSIALTTDTSALTAIANDYGYEYVFSRQLIALGQQGDVLVAFTTSGKSKNILNAIYQARKLGIHTICLTGENGLLSSESEIEIRVPSSSTPLIQEAHTSILHILCSTIETSLFG